jgi:hypothetical protein
MLVVCLFVWREREKHLLITTGDSLSLPWGFHLSSVLIGRRTRVVVMNRNAEENFLKLVSFKLSFKSTYHFSKQSLNIITDLCHQSLNVITFLSSHLLRMTLTVSTYYYLG